MPTVIFETGADELRLTDNDLQTVGDGGRVVLVAQSKALKAATGADLLTLILNYSEDEPMESWPYLKNDRQNRRFKLTITEEERVNTTFYPGSGLPEAPLHPNDHNVQITEQQVRQYEQNFVILWSQLQGVPSAVSDVAAMESRVVSLESADAALDSRLDTLETQHLNKTYSLSTHSHAGVYALVGHNHDAAYAAIGHNHTGVYAPVGHTHTAAEVGAATAGHNHAVGALSDVVLTGLAAGQILQWDAANSQWVNTTPGAAAVDQTGNYNWTGTHAFTILPTVGGVGVALTDHNHSGVYSPVGHNHDSLYSPLGHTHPYLPLSGGTLTGALAVAGAATFSALTSSAGLRATAASIAASGSGLELLYSSQGIVQAYNRTGAVWTDLLLKGANTQIEASTGNIPIFTNGSERGRITSAGILAWGTTVTTGASAGDVVLGNAKALRGVNAAGTLTLPGVKLDASNEWSFGWGASSGVEGLRVNAAGAVAIGSASLTGAAYGELVLPNNSAVRGVTAAGTASLPICFLDANNIARMNGTNEVTGIGAGGAAPAAAAARNGGIYIDASTNRLCYYSNGARYYIAGVAF